MHGFIFETGIAYGNIISGMSDESLNVEVSFVVTIYREVGNAHESMWKQATTEFGLDKAINRGEICLVDPTNGIVEVEFDEESLIGDESLDMMQKK